jgi:hypothetical protein
VDNRDSLVPKVTPEEAAKLCDQNFGIGADGVIFVMPGVNGADYTMRIFNSDGSEPKVRVSPPFHHYTESYSMVVNIIFEAVVILIGSDSSLPPNCAKLCIVRWHSRITAFQSLLPIRCRFTM